MKKILYVFLIIILASCEKAPQVSEVSISIDNPFGTELTTSLGMSVYSSNDLANPLYAGITMDLKEGDVYRSDINISLDKECSFNFYLYGPYSGSELRGNRFALNVPEDQKSLEDFSSVDYIYAAVENTLPASTLTVEGSHLMTQVEIRISDISDTENKMKVTDVILSSFSADGEIELTSRTIIPDPNKKDLVAKLEVSDNMIVAKAIVLPQTIYADQASFVLMSEGDLIAEIPVKENLEMRSATKNIFSVNINGGVSYDYSVEEWDETFMEEVDPIWPSITEVTDIDGNIYPARIIGDLYWMCSELKVTKFNDGTPITLATKASEWVESSQLMCYYNFASDNSSDKGGFYNWETVKSGKLCPPGWRVPTREEWLAMREFAGGKYYAGENLKMKSGWKDAQNDEKEEFQGNDRFSFGARPTGYVDDRANFDHSQEGYGPESIATYWSSTASSSIRQYTYEIYYMAPNLEEKEDVSSAFGRSVRCVKSIKY